MKIVNINDVDYKIKKISGGATIKLLNRYAVQIFNIIQNKENLKTSPFTDEDIDYLLSFIMRNVEYSQTAGKTAVFMPVVTESGVYNIEDAEELDTLAYIIYEFLLVNGDFLLTRFSKKFPMIAEIKENLMSQIPQLMEDFAGLTLENVPNEGKE